MRQSIRHSARWTAGGLALGLLTLGCATMAPVATTPASTPAATAFDARLGVLRGTATLPAEMVEAHHVIPTGIGRVIPTGHGRYRLQAALEELPVTGALVTLRDLSTREPLAGVESVQTDARGAFAIPGVPSTENVLIEVTFTVSGQEAPWRLLAVGKASAGPETTPDAHAVSWRSTAMVSRALSEPGGLDLLTAAPEVLREAEFAEADRLSGLSDAERKAALSAALSGATTLFERLTPTPGPSRTPGSQPSVAPVALPSVLKSALPVLGGTLSDTVNAVEDVTEDSVGTLTDTASDVLEPVTGAVGQLLNPTPEPSAKPSPLIPLPGFGLF